MSPFSKITYFFTISLLFTCNTFKTRDLRVVQICGTKDFGLSKTREISEDSKAGRLLSRYREYETLLAEMQKEESTEELKKIVENTKQRMKTIQEGIQSSIERKGDEYYNRYEFGKAIESYLDAKSYLSTRSGSDKIIEGLDKKIRLSRETGEGYLENKVRGYVDQAVLLNLEGNKGDSKKSLNIAKSEMDRSIFTVPKAIEAYNEASEILKVSKYEANADCAEAGRVAILETSQTTLSGKSFKNSIGMEFVQIPVGSFEMGCVQGDTECSNDEKPQHRVNITKPFYMGKYEVTQGQWKAVMGKNPSSFSNCGENCPVESVSWDDVQEFIQKLCKKENMSSCKYRLPTEAEWEYSARSGSKIKYYWGNTMDGSYAWYSDNSGSKTHLVGQKKPNAWGLYDMSGNVWEWVQDRYDSGYYGKNTSNDPVGAYLGSDRVGRGGSWLSYDGECRSSYRFYFTPDIRNRYLGFRLARTP